METDASNFALGAILSQFGIDGLLHPVAFYSRKLTSAEINYQVYDKELLAIITAFEQWRPYLAGAQHRVQVLTDHKNLLYFTTTRTLNRCQARWSIFLADFDFEIQYQPDTQQGKVDVLSRRLKYELRAGDEAYGQQNQTLLNPEQFRVTATISTLPTHTLSGTSRWQLRKTLGLPTPRRNSRNDQGTQIVMTWISLSSKTDFSFEIT
jgi:hypothetical protein